MNETDDRDQSPRINAEIKVSLLMKGIGVVMVLLLMKVEGAFNSFFFQCHV